MLLKSKYDVGDTVYTIISGNIAEVTIIEISMWQINKNKQSTKYTVKNGGNSLLVRGIKEKDLFLNKIDAAKSLAK